EPRARRPQPADHPARHRQGPDIRLGPGRGRIRTGGGPLRAADGLNAPVRERAARAASFDKGAVFRLSRMLHAYLSAFAFLALFFFSATGVLLDHPEWFES